MRILFTTLMLCLIVIFTAKSQTRISWTDTMVISESSFQDEAPEMAEDYIQQMSFHTNYDFGFEMVNAQFAFTKNFNKYVEAFYIPELSWKESGELDADLIMLANLHFDISELYARKLRKGLYDNKRFSSNANFFNDVYTEVHHEQIKLQAEINSQLSATDDWSVIISKYQEEVNEGVIELADFCMTCKPPKKKR